MSSEATAAMIRSTALLPADVVLQNLRKRKVADWAAGGVFFLAAASSIVITVGIVAILMYESAQFFTHVPVIDFVTETDWDPLRPAAGEDGYNAAFPPKFGIWPLVCGTLVTTVVALAIALPVG